MKFRPDLFPLVRLWGLTYEVHMCLDHEGYCTTVAFWMD